MQMIEKNIFRPLPNVKKSNLNFAETGVEQEEEMDPAWPHLQGIYEFFLRHADEMRPELFKNCLFSYTTTTASIWDKKLDLKLQVE